MTVNRWKRRKRAQGTLHLTSPPVPGEAPEIGNASESETQKAILDLLDHHPKVAWAARMNTGSGFLLNGRVWKSLLSGGRVTADTARFVRFAFPGCSDILGQLRDGRFLAIEVKSPIGRVSEDQRAFLSNVSTNNGCAFVARSVEDVLEHIPLVERSNERSN